MCLALVLVFVTSKLPNNLLSPSQQRKLFKAKKEFSRLWGPEHVKSAMMDLSLGEQDKKGGGATWKVLIDPRYIRGIFLCFTSCCFVVTLLRIYTREF